LENKTMTRKLFKLFELILIAMIVGVGIGSCSTSRSGTETNNETQIVGNTFVETNDEIQAVKDTILRARRIQLEAEYTFDTSKYETVFINDPRGGEVTPLALELIQKTRHDPTLRIDQVGSLDAMTADIGNLKILYDNYMDGLRAKEATGTLNEDEILILQGETNGWASLESEKESTTAMLPTCESLPSNAAYPAPEPRPCAPTPNPTPLTLALGVPYRGTDPAKLPADEFDIAINSVQIDGDIAKVVVQKRSVTSEYTLVKVGGQWYIAGAKLLKSEP
jgi:hypothetical protein